MITLLIILAYLLPGLAVYRRVGYAIENGLRNGKMSHEYKSICTSCNCRHCGDNEGRHARRWHYCNEFQPRALPHFRTFLAFLPTLFFYPLVLGVWGIKTTTTHYGIEASFWKPAPEIKSKEEREAIRKAERETKIKELEADNDRLARELRSAGIEA